LTDVLAVDNVPKFQVYGSLLLGAVGRSDVLTKLHDGTRRMIDDAKPRFLQVAASLPHILRNLHGNRALFSDINPADDRLQVLLCGFDPSSWRIRCFAYVSDNDFREIETTQDPSNRIVAFAAVADTDLSELRTLTARMAKPRGAAWIASQLRDTINTLSEKNVQVGQARFFAGIDARGLISLPEEFSVPEAA
jgi:hypothetical protein